MVISAFITHKHKEFFANCQDRFGVNSDTKSVAVSDGMGSTWMQKIWAKLLVETYIKDTNWCPSRDSIKPLCKMWRNEVLEVIENLKDTNAPENVIYRNERNLAEGNSAGATFVGIRFNGNKWSGSVLGDTCLIEWDGKEAKFNTSQETEYFDSYPDYFDSNESREGRGIPRSIEGVLTEGNYLLLVSDPFSDFLLKHYKQGNIAEYIHQLLLLDSHDDFEELVCEWRKEDMHDDDSTLVIVGYDGSDIFTITHSDIDKMVENEKMSHNSTVKEEKISPPQEVPYQKDDEEVENFVVEPNDVKVFCNEFLSETQRNLQKKLSKRKLKFIGVILKVLEEVLKVLLERYTIIKK